MPMYTYIAFLHSGVSVIYVIYASMLTFWATRTRYAVFV